MQALLLLLLSKPTQYKVEQAVQKDNYENEYISIIFGLIDSHNEAIAFHDQ